MGARSKNLFFYTFALAKGILEEKVIKISILLNKGYNCFIIR